MVRARLCRLGLDAERTASVALDQRPDIFRRFEAWEADRSGFSGGCRPGQAYVFDHALAPIVKG